MPQPFYVEAALEVIERGWKTSLFAPFYHQTGYLMLCSGKAHQKSGDAVERARAFVDSHPAFKDGIQTTAFRQNLRPAADGARMRCAARHSRGTRARSRVLLQSRSRHQTAKDIWPLGAGYTEARPGGTTLPSEEPVLDFDPAAYEAKLRRLLKEALPSLADRPLVDEKMCWFSDSGDSEYCIDFVPNTNKSLVALAGDSGHGFKMLYIFGKWMVELLSRGGQDRDVWRWRSDASNADWGSGVSWRIGEASELRDVLAEEGRRRLKAKL